MKIQLFSDYNFFVVANNFQQELSKFNKIEICLNDVEQSHIMLYPLGVENSIPFCIKFSPVPQKQNNLQIYKTNCGYDIFVEPKLVYKKDYHIQKLIVGRTSHIVRVFSEHLEFECKDICKVANIAIQNPDIRSINGNIIVFGNHKNKMACCVFCTKTKRICTYVCEQMEIVDKTLKLLIPQNTFVSHLALKTFSLETSGITEISNELYSKHSPSIQPDELIAYKFLEAVFVADEKLAKSYLSNDLAQSPIAAFSEFFGNPKHIDFSPPCTYTLYENNKAKNFEFVIENGKICEIVEKN